MSTMWLFFTLSAVLLNTCVWGQSDGIYNRNNEKSPQTLFTHYYSCVYIHSIGEADSVRIVNNNEVSIFKSGFRKMCFYIKPKSKQSNTFYLNVNGKKRIYHFSTTDEIIPPDIKLSRKCMEGVCSRADSIILHPHFDDVYNNTPNQTYKIISYEVEINRKGTVLFREKSSGTQFSADFRKKHMQSIIDDRVIVRNIVIEDREGNFVTVEKEEIWVW